MTKRWTLILILVLLCGGLFACAEYFVAYPAHVRSKYAEMKHPEFIPDIHTVRIGSAGYTTLVGDMEWLSAIQYVGSSIRSEGYKAYLAKLLNLITDIDPKFTEAYKFGELLLASDTRLGDDDERKQESLQYNNDARDLGLKGLKNICDADKIAAIRAEPDLHRIMTESRYADPCMDYTIPYYLGFVEYWGYLDGKSAADYYRITAANHNAPPGAKLLAGIMEGKGGDREKSTLMFISLAESVSGSGACSPHATELLGALEQTVSQGVTGQSIKDLWSLRDAMRAETGGINEGDDTNTIACSGFLDRAVREINLFYLEKADELYMQSHGNQSAKTAETLLWSGIIDMIPEEYSTGTGSHIIYEYDDKLRHWDYHASSPPPIPRTATGTIITATGTTNTGATATGASATGTTNTGATTSTTGTTSPSLK